jgi:glycosyltransferase involved in cell wall biosynthesis
VRLLIISNMSHYMRDGKVVGWGPTVEEISHLSRMFDEVRHVALLHSEPAPPSALPYASDRVRLVAVPPAGGTTSRAKLELLTRVPLYLRTVSEELGRADVVHVRCPASIPLLALVLLAMRRNPRYRWIKYAGNWSPSGPRSPSYSFQRWWLSLGLHRGVVTVNGRWPNQPKHVVSFLNPSFNGEELGGRDAKRELSAPYRLLYVGYMNAGKGAARALEVASILKQRGLPFEMEFVGDGPLKSGLEAEARTRALDTSVKFLGWLPKPELPGHYARAHFFVSPSSSEGWPKVLSEAMAFGAVPIAGDVSCIAQVLSECGSGVALPPSDAMAFADAIMGYAADGVRWRAQSQAGTKAAEMFTYDTYLERVREMMRNVWGLRLPAATAGDRDRGVTDRAMDVRQ